jgi:parallel beta-helix repeat protein
VYLLEGQFAISTSSTNGAGIQMATGTQLIGSGPGTVLRVPNSTNGDIFVINAATTSNIHIAQLSIDGNSTNQTTGNHYGIQFTAVSSSTIDTVTIKNTLRDAVYINNSRSNNITNNILHNSFYGITITGTSQNNIITNNIANTNAQYGIGVLGAGNTVVGNSTIGNTFYGIYLDGATRNTVTGNISRQNGAYGVYVGNVSTDNSITGNTLNANSIAGLYLNSGPLYNTISGNNLNSNTTYGIRFNAASNNTITGNTIDANAVAISLDTGSLNNLVDGNSLTLNTLGGLYIGNASNNNTITSNRFYDNAGATASSTIEIRGTSIGTLLSSNHITDTSGTGYAIRTDNLSTATIYVGNSYSGTGASSIGDFATGTTKYTQWDRITLETSSTTGQVAYSLFGAVGSSSVALASTTQLGTGNVISLNNSTGEVFTVPVFFIEVVLTYSQHSP